MVLVGGGWVFPVVVVCGFEGADTDIEKLTCTEMLF